METCPKCSRSLEPGEELCPACAAKKNRKKRELGKR